MGIISCGKGLSWAASRPPIHFVRTKRAIACAVTAVELVVVSQPFLGQNQFAIGVLFGDNKNVTGRLFIIRRLVATHIGRLAVGQRCPSRHMLQVRIGLVLG
ncbi:hypothetical protein BpHYR1_035080, partial [Brachionus plicatilis]